MSAQRYNIADGPNKWKLVMALAEKNDDGSPKRVVFILDGPSFMLNAPPDRFTARITGLKLEDGSTDSWLIEGLTSVPDPRSGNTPYRLRMTFEGWFDTRSRKGWVDIRF